MQVKFCYIYLRDLELNLPNYFRVSIKAVANWQTRVTPKRLFISSCILDVWRKMNIEQMIAGIDIPWTALTGGMLIGLATTLFLLANGRIAGISGIVGGIAGGLLHFRWRDLDWRLAFILGLVVSTLIWQQFFSLPDVQIQASDMMLVIAGVLVGFGTRLGSGCTSGHGVCGMARLSPRSVVATLMFMSTGFAVVYLLRHVFV